MPESIIENDLQENTNTDLDPISATEARAILEAALTETLGEGWEDDDAGWLRVTGHDYMARVSRGRYNLDFYVDILGNVTIEKNEIDPVQNSGAFIAILLIGVSIAVAVLVSQVVGWF